MTNALHYMSTALALARRGLGNVGENPAVGCVLVNDARVVGRGFTQPGGRPHAETVALAQAGELAKGAAVFVTLEPCSHQGKTPPCVEALIKAGVSKVWVALADPNPAIDGRGVAALKQAGIDVDYGLCLPEALFLNQGYILRRTLQRPLVIGKIATSQDGAMALANGRSQWVTGAMARAHAHATRASVDALITGIGTVMADNPQMTCRLPGLEERLPLRVVLDSQLRLSAEYKIVQQAQQHPLCVYTLPALADSPQADSLRQHGVTVVGIEASEKDNPLSGVRPWGVLHDLAERGINRVLLEAGGRLMSSFLRDRLIDRLMWYRGNAIFGDDAQPAFGPLGLELLDQAPLLYRVSESALGQDRLDIYLLHYG